MALQSDDHPVKDFEAIDDKTMQEIMCYLKLEDYDVFCELYYKIGNSS
jgi:hypothetical protein